MLWRTGIGHLVGNHTAASFHPKAFKRTPDTKPYSPTSAFAHNLLTGSMGSQLGSSFTKAGNECVQTLVASSRSAVCRMVSGIQSFTAAEEVNAVVAQAYGFRRTSQPQSTR